jgi:hypothetical protein
MPAQVYSPQSNEASAKLVFAFPGAEARTTNNASIAVMLVTSDIEPRMDN